MCKSCCYADSWSRKYTKKLQYISHNLIFVGSTDIHKQLTWNKQPSLHEKCLPVSKAFWKSSQESNDKGKYSPAWVCSVMCGDFPGPPQSAGVLPVTLMEPGTTSGLSARRRARSPQHNAVSIHPEGQQETHTVAQMNLGNDHILSKYDSCRSIWLASLSTIGFRIKRWLNYSKGAIFHSSQIHSPTEHKEGKMGPLNTVALRLMGDLNAQEMQDLVIRVFEREL